MNGSSKRGRRRPRLPSRTGPPAAAGRWSLSPARSTSPTRRRHAVAEQLLRRHGVLLRGDLSAERVGGFASVYPILKALEERGACRRGYFVEGLGAAQFALSGAVDRMRALAAHNNDDDQAVVLSAADPANPYGAALPWPERASEVAQRAGRKAGSVVVLIGGLLTLYVERGGRTALSYSDDPIRIRSALAALADWARRGFLPRFEIQRIDGRSVRESELAEPLKDAGFVATHRGYELRA